MAQRAHVVNVSNRCYLPLLNANRDTILTLFGTVVDRRTALVLRFVAQWVAVPLQGKDRFNHLWE